MPCIILDDLEFSGGKRNGDGQKPANGNQTNAPASGAATEPPAPAQQAETQMPGNFTGYENFGGGNSFFNL